MGSKGHTFHFLDISFEIQSMYIQQFFGTVRKDFENFWTTANTSVPRLRLRKRKAS